MKESSAFGQSVGGCGGGAAVAPPHVMTIPPTLRLAVSLLVADGVAALYLAEFLGPLGVGLVLGAVAVSWWSEPLRLRVALHLRLGRMLVPVAAVGSVVDVLYVAETVLDAAVRLLLFLVLYKLVTLRSVRETRAVGFLGLFMLIAASSSAFGVGFLFVFLAFVVLATWVALQQHVLLEAESNPGRAAWPDGRAWPGPALLRLAFVASAGVLALTAGLFFVLPRIGLAALPLRARFGQMVTGFSDRVELGGYGSIATNETVVMRVHIPEGPDDPQALPNLRWRGIVLDEFDGQAWSVRHPRQVRLLQPRGAELQLGLLRGPGPVLRQEIYLEPIGTEIVFAAPRVLRLGLRADAVSLDDMGSVSVPPPSARLYYTVESQLEAPVGSGGPVAGRAPPLDTRARARYLQLPSLPARVSALARQVAGDSRDPSEAAQRLVGFLSREFRYTLNIERLTTLEPLDEFLFVRRAGHCEYFAAALAVMLRSLDIPARIVNGFQRGEWNPYGRYFMVRLRDAHSWVEAHVGDAGWVTLDPSPRAAAERWEAPSTALLYVDALRLQWHRYIISWSLGDQLGAALALRRHASRWGPWLQAETAEWGHSRGAWSGIAALGAGLALLFWWRDRPTSAARAANRPPRFYARALRRAARRGLRPGLGETAREFSLRVGQLGPAWDRGFTRLTREYERCRFGEAQLTATELADLDRSVSTLGASRADVETPRHPPDPPPDLSTAFGLWPGGGGFRSARRSLHRLPAEPEP